VNDVALAIYSDRLFMAAVGGYVLAMVLHAAEYATVRAARPTVAADAPVAVVAAVGSDERPARRIGSDERAARCTIGASRGSSHCSAAPTGPDGYLCGRPRLLP